MKKLFVMLMALTVLGVQVGAQPTKAKDAPNDFLKAALISSVGVVVKDSQKKKEDIDIHVAKTVAAAPKYANETSLESEAAKTFATYFAANPDGEVQEAAYAPLADLLTTAQELNALIARTSNIDDKENYAMQFFFSQDIAGKYAALKAVNPQLAAATNELMRSFIGTVSNGTFYGGKDHPDMQTLRAFKADIGYKY